MRFELTEHFCSSVFKTGAINRALPHFHLLMVQPPGIEPGSTVLQTAAMTTSAKVAKSVVNYLSYYTPLTRASLEPPGGIEPPLAK